MTTAQIFLPGKSYGQRRLAGYSPWGCEESDTIAHTHTLTNSVLNVLVLFLDLMLDDRDIFNSFTIYPIIKALAIN